MADFRVTVADQTLRSVRDTVRLRTAIGEGDGKRPSILVVNRHGEGGRHAVTLQELQHVVELKPKSVIPFQPTSPLLRPGFNAGKVNLSHSSGGLSHMGQNRKQPISNRASGQRRFDFVVNPKTANALGRAIAPSI